MSTPARLKEGGTAGERVKCARSESARLNQAANDCNDGLRAALMSSAAGCWLCADAILVVVSKQQAAGWLSYGAWGSYSGSAECCSKLHMFTW